MSDETDVQHSKIWAKVVALVLCVMIICIAAYDIVDRITPNQRLEIIKKIANE